MSTPLRRNVLHAAAGIGLAGLAGCLDRSVGSSRETNTPSDRPGSGESLTDWEASTDCDRTPTGMYDSIISVEQVLVELPDGYVPIRFGALSENEKDILRTVTEVGGYATCDASDAFVRFVGRVGTHREKQRDSVAEDMHVFLERAGSYYRLYVEKQDEVFAY